MVILPDYLKGQWIDPEQSTPEELINFVRRETQWEAVIKPHWEERIKPYAIEHGALTFGAIGIPFSFNFSNASTI